MAFHILVQGGLGQGKTALMSILAHYWRVKVRENGGDLKLFSNYGLKDSYPMTHFTDWYEVAKAQGSICCWDEAHMAFSNRKWNTYGQGLATELMMYTRKMQSVQIYCTPNVGNVDTRIRQIIEVVVDVRKIGKKGFSYNFRDFQTGQNMVSHFLPMSKANIYFKQNLYDTHQMVQGFPLPPSETEGKKFFAKLEEVHDIARGKVRVS